MSLKVVIVGAVALGPKVACRVKRLDPDAEVTMIDRSAMISYGGCGIPYYVSGDISEATALMETNAHQLRDAAFFRGAKGVRVLTRTEAVAIDRTAKTVQVKNLDTGEEQDLPYDKLVLATGSSPFRLPIPGIDLDGVFAVAGMDDAIQIKERIAAGQVGRAVVIGAGAIGLEMVEAMTDLWGVETAVVEWQDQLLPGVVPPNLGRMVQEHLHEHDVNEIYVSEKVTAIEGDGRVERVVTDKRTIDADLVIMAVGVRPNSELAKAAGLDVSPRGGIAVNLRFETSDPDILAGGDCVENIHLITQKPVYMPLGSLANRHGRIIGSNVTGMTEEFPGVVGSFILKAFELSVAATGLTLQRARDEGFDAFSAFVVQSDRAHFYPKTDLMYLELVVDKKTGRVLGMQGVADAGDALACRIDAVAAILKYNPTVSDISNLEIAYAPPFSSAMDILNALGNTAENIMVGKNRVLDIEEFDRMFNHRQNGDFVCLDVRAKANAEEFVEKYSDIWVNIPQDELCDRLDEVPRDKELILICNSGIRSYEAQIYLDHHGLDRTRNLQGGWGAMRKFGMKLV